MGKTIMQSPTSVTDCNVEIFAMLDNHRASRPTTEHSIGLHFSCKSKSLFLIMQMVAPETLNSLISSHSALFPNLNMQSARCHSIDTSTLYIPPSSRDWPLWCIRMTSVMTSRRTTGMTRSTPMMMEGVKSDASSSNSFSSLARCLARSSLLPSSFATDSCSWPSALSSMLLLLSENKLCTFFAHPKITWSVFSQQATEGRTNNWLF